jgi:cytochrome c
MSRIIATLSLAAAILGGIAGSASAQDAEKGEVVFKGCLSCHRVGDDAKNGVGPVQNNLFGRKAGTVEGFRYSTINAAAGEAGLVWTEENVFTYLEDPNAFLRKFLADKGKTGFEAESTKMAYKLVDEQKRKDVIAYLKKFTK